MDVAPAARLRHRPRIDHEALQRSTPGGTAGTRGGPVTPAARPHPARGAHLYASAATGCRRAGNRRGRTRHARADRGEHVAALRDFHAEMQFAVLAALVAGVVLALWWSRRQALFRRVPFSIAVGILDLQVLVGIVIWFEGEGWDLGVVQGILHPLLALAALGVAHAALVRGRRTQDAGAAYRMVAIGLAVATAVVLLAVIAAVGSP